MPSGVAPRWCATPGSCLSTIQSAIGVKHPSVAQRDGLHGRLVQHARVLPRRQPGAFVPCARSSCCSAFVVPLILLGHRAPGACSAALQAAFGVQYVGLLAERWFFFAQARHPQNLYYQAVS